MKVIIILLYLIFMILGCTIMFTSFIAGVFSFGIPSIVQGVINLFFTAIGLFIALFLFKKKNENIIRIFAGMVPGASFAILFEKIFFDY